MLPGSLRLLIGSNDQLNLSPTRLRLSFFQEQLAQEAAAQEEQMQNEQMMNMAEKAVAPVAHALATLTTGIPV